MNPEVQIKYISKKELARLWGYSVRTIEKFMREGWLPHQKRGLVRFDVEECDRIFKARYGRNTPKK